MRLETRLSDGTESLGTRLVYVYIISVFLAHSCDTGHLLERQSGRAALKMGSDCELAGIKELTTVHCSRNSYWL